MAQQFEEANEHDGLSGKNLSGNHQQPSGPQGRRFNLSSKSRLFQRLMTTAHGREARQFFQSQAFAVNEKWRSGETNVPSVWKREVPVPNDSLRVRQSGRSPNPCRRKSLALSAPGCAYTKVVQFVGFVGGIRILTILKLEACSPAT
jgi:hypothetical protein